MRLVAIIPTITTATISRNQKINNKQKKLLLEWLNQIRKTDKIHQLVNIGNTYKKYAH